MASWQGSQLRRRERNGPKWEGRYTYASHLSCFTNKFFFTFEDKSDFYFKWLKTWSHSSSLNVQWTFVIQSTTSLIKEWHCSLQKRIKSTTKYFLTLSLTFEFWVLCVRLEYSGRHTRDRLWVFLSQVVLWFRNSHLYWYIVSQTKTFHW